MHRLAANAAFPLSFSFAASPLATTDASSGYCCAKEGFSATARSRASYAMHSICVLASQTHIHTTTRKPVHALHLVVVLVTVAVIVISGALGRQGGF